MTPGAPPPTKHEIVGAVSAMILTVDERARDCNRKLGDRVGFCYEKRAETVVEHRSALTNAKGYFAMADKPICSIQNCCKPRSIRGWCNVHYKRWLSHGDPLAGRTPNGEMFSFLETAFVFQSDDCLLWPYGKNEKGYGRLHIGGKLRRAHRVVCETVHGAPPTETHEAAHGCGVRSCVNPRHLRWARPVENQSDVTRHGTRTQTRLTEGQVRDIIAAYGVVSGPQLAKQFGVSQTTISDIHRQKTWRHLRDGEPS